MKETILAIAKLVQERPIINHGSIRCLYSEQAVSEIESVEELGEDEEVGTDYIGDDDLYLRLEDVSEHDNLKIAAAACEKTEELMDLYLGESVNDYLEPDKEDELDNLEQLIEKAQEWADEIELDKTPVELLKDAIEYCNEDQAIAIAKLLKNKLSISYDDDEPYQAGGDIDDPWYVVRNYTLELDGESVAEWTICACGFYSSGRENPNHSWGWNTEEDTNGGDGLRDDTLIAVLEELDLLDEAKELPDVPEPDKAEECDEEEAEYALMHRNPYSNCPDYEPESYYPTHEDAEKALNEAYRDFRARHGDNSYGPEWAIASWDGEKWVVEEELDIA